MIGPPPNCSFLSQYLRLIHQSLWSIFFHPANHFANRQSSYCPVSGSRSRYNCATVSHLPSPDPTRRCPELALQAAPLRAHLTLALGVTGTAAVLSFRPVDYRKFTSYGSISNGASQAPCNRFYLFHFWMLFKWLLHVLSLPTTILIAIARILFAIPNRTAVQCASWRFCGCTWKISLQLFLIRVCAKICLYLLFND